MGLMDILQSALQSVSDVGRAEGKTAACYAGKCAKTGTDGSFKNAEICRRCKSAWLLLRQLHTLFAVH